MSQSLLDTAKALGDAAQAALNAGTPATDPKPTPAADPQAKSKAADETDDKDDTLEEKVAKLEKRCAKLEDQLKEKDGEAKATADALDSAAKAITFLTGTYAKAKAAIEDPALFRIGAGTAQRPQVTSESAGNSEKKTAYDTWAAMPDGRDKDAYFVKNAPAIDAELEKIENQKKGA